MANSDGTVQVSPPTQSAFAKSADTGDKAKPAEAKPAEPAEAKPAEPDHAKNALDSIAEYVKSKLGIGEDKGGGAKLAPSSTPDGDTPKPGTANDIADAVSGAIKSVPGRNADY